MIKIQNTQTYDLFDGLMISVREKEAQGFQNEKVEKSLKQLFEKELFIGKIGESYAVTLELGDSLKDVIFLGLGTPESFNVKTFKNTLADSYRLLQKKKVSHVSLNVLAYTEAFCCENRFFRSVGEAVTLANYDFNDFKSDKKDHHFESLTVISSSAKEAALEEGVALGKATLLARQLTNLPANILTPSKLADMAVDAGKESGFEVEVKGRDQIENLNMHAFMEVAKASAQEPKLIVMRYNGNPHSDQRLGYVGKGLTYDSGGLSIKPTAGMVDMKTDMGGASAVIGAMVAISNLKLKINVTAVVAACENMISGVSYKPGDIIQSMGGKSIFIGNTDAEGRLTLVDAVTYIQEYEKVTSVVDIATLTGAAIHCLGSAGSPMISSDDTFASAVVNAFEKAGENTWRMPIFEEYKELIKHELADLTNTAGSPGTITAGMFIGEFVKDIPWVHIDIAGTASASKPKGILSKGGTGVGVRPLYFLAKKMAD